MDTAALVTSITHLLYPSLPADASREWVYQAARTAISRLSGGGSAS